MKKLLILTLFVLLYRLGFSQTLYRVVKIETGDWSSYYNTWVNKTVKYMSSMQMYMYGNLITVTDGAKSNYRVGDALGTDDEGCTYFSGSDEKNRPIGVSICEGNASTPVSLLVVYESTYFIRYFIRRN